MGVGIPVKILDMKGQRVNAVEWQDNQQTVVILIWVGTGRTSEVFSGFLQQLPQETAAGIKAVAMDMGSSYQKSVRDCLLSADIVFDRFHVMQNCSKAIQNQRRIEFRKANKSSQELMKGTHYLLLKNADKLTGKQGSLIQYEMSLKGLPYSKVKRP